MLNRNRRGFTLIELLIVLAIFGILTATFHRALQESFKGHAMNSYDQKLLLLLAGQEAILRSAPYQDLMPGVKRSAPELLKGAGIPGVQASFTTEELRPLLKRITLTADYPLPTGKQRSLSVIIYRSNRP